ncbi:MAG TPA: hypothetical protein VEW67_01895 [Thermoleophilaceae bacterium]|nr:hypothetical protein [Thermoleophilaceae bacterium]
MEAREWKTGAAAAGDRRPCGQIKSRERVRDLAEVYTHEREVNAMLDLVPDMFPSERQPANTDRTFLEPACGDGNFLVEILRRKLAYVTRRRYGRSERFEHRMLRCLASVYGIDISDDNVRESHGRMRAVLDAHAGTHLGAGGTTPGFCSAADTILKTNIICADTLADASEIEFVEYRPGSAGTFTRQWSSLEPRVSELNFFSFRPRRDAVPIHYSDLSDNPGPVAYGPAERTAA